ncbi:MAG TPA: hexose kinase [Roseiflexaceae bacterium]|nr:hexose kinase [Roseiflexaceae bacterium]
MLFCFTPNPSIDRVLLTPGFRHAETVRVAETRDAAGAKGMNVARVARALGLPVRVCGPLAGANGQRIAALAQAEGFDARWSWLQAGESRICLLVIDQDTRDTLVINERGPVMSAADWDVLARLVTAEAEPASAVASSGSLPPGVEAGQLITLLRELMGRRPVYLDTSGAVLAAALDLPLALIKVNADELGHALGEPIATAAQARAAAASVRARGPAAVIVTLGRAGAVAVDERGAWLARAPDVAAISAVGSGDAVLAGVAAALAERCGLAEALRLGVACGAANTLTIGAGIVDSADITRLRAATKLEEM